MAERERVDAYLDTVSRIEPDIAPLDQDGSHASIAISLKRIADQQSDLDLRLRNGFCTGLGLCAAVIVVVLVYKTIHWVIAWPM